MANRLAPKLLEAGEWIGRVLPLIGPLLILAAVTRFFAFANGAVLPAAYVALSPAVASDHLAHEWRARMIWESSVVLLVVTELAAIAFALWIFGRFIAPRWRRPMTWGMLILAAVGAAVAAASDLSFAYLRDAVLTPTLGSLHEVGLLPLSVAAFGCVRMLTNGLAAVAMITVIAAIIACTTMAKTVVADGESTERLGEQMRALNALLYVGAAMLVAVTLSMLAWLQWPAAVIADPAGQRRVLDIAVGIGLYWGTTFTAVVAAAYVPAHLHLRERAFELARTRQRDATPADLSRFIQEQGLSMSLSGQLTRMAAVLSPLASGLLPVLSSLLWPVT